MTDLTPIPFFSQLLVGVQSFKTEFELMPNGFQILININRKSKSRACKYYVPDQFTQMLLKT